VMKATLGLIDEVCKEAITVDASDSWWMSLQVEVYLGGRGRHNKYISGS
jgi:hypothetical protein